MQPPRISTLFPYTTLFRSNGGFNEQGANQEARGRLAPQVFGGRSGGDRRRCDAGLDRKSTRLNSSHGYISYAVFCLKKKKRDQRRLPDGNNNWAYDRGRSG